MSYTPSTAAEVIYFNASQTGTLVAKHSNFVSYQDTLQLKGFNWFYDSFITGDTDFIWGNANIALFEQCEIKSRVNGNRLERRELARDSGQHRGAGGAGRLQHVIRRFRVLEQRADQGSRHIHRFPGTLAGRRAGSDRNAVRLLGVRHRLLHRVHAWTRTSRRSGGTLSVKPTRWGRT